MSALEASRNENKVTENCDRKGRRPRTDCRLLAVFTLEFPCRRHSILFNSHPIKYSEKPTSEVRHRGAKLLNELDVQRGTLEWN